MVIDGGRDGGGPGTGREYLRVSLDRSGRARSLDEQHADNETAAARRGVALGEPYRDNSVSASRYSTKARDDFDRLLADLRSGAFGADELWLWESSRGSRRVGEWVDLIEACEAARVGIFVTTHGRAYDPGNGRDRRSLLEDAVDSEYESSKVSARAKRAAAANAAAGKPHGRTPYGYRRRYDPDTRRLIVQESFEPEARVVREVYARLVAGHSLLGIADDLAARGVVNGSGRPFSAQHLRDFATNPVYAGVRLHDPDARSEHRGRRAARSSSSTCTTVPGTWEALVDAETFHAVQRILSDPRRVTSRPGKARHLLSMTAVCGVCGNVLTVTMRSGRPEYQCRRPGCVRIVQADLDELAEQAMLGYLARPDVYAELRATTDAGGRELARVRGELEAARAEHEALLRAVGDGRVSVAALAHAEPAMLARVRDLEVRERDLAAPPALRGLVGPGPDVAQRWRDTPVSTRREVARILLSPSVLGTLAVLRRPAGCNGHVPAVERVQWRRA